MVQVTPSSNIELKWEKPDEEGLVDYLCNQKGFAEDRVRNGSKKLLKARQGSTQGRLDGFFKVISSSPAAKNGIKRKSGDTDKNNAKKKKGGGNFGKFKR